MENYVPEKEENANAKLLGVKSRMLDMRHERFREDCKVRREREVRTRTVTA